MFRVLIVDDNFEDRELLKLELERALGEEGAELRFAEASSVPQARKLLDSGHYDLMTLDIEFDRMNEGLNALPDLFDAYPTLNIVIVSGKLNKAEVAQNLFRFTKENIFKSKRWVRHFDVLDKKDDKVEAFRRVYAFAVTHGEIASKVKDLFLLAESYLERDMIDKCVEVYQRIQQAAPGETESEENLQIFQGLGSVEAARDIFRRGEPIAGALVLGYHIERRLKQYTEKMLGHHYPALADCMKHLVQKRVLSSSREGVFRQLIHARNQAIHHPATVGVNDFTLAQDKLELLEPGVS